MLFDIKYLEKKIIAEKGNQEALYELAETYSNKYKRIDLANELYSKIIANDYQCKPEHYLNSILFVAACKMDDEKIAEALRLYKRAKEFMESNMPKEDWKIRVYEYIAHAKKIMLLKERIQEGDQEALYELATDWKNEEFGMENDKLATKYFNQLISDKCKIDKGKYIDAYLFVGWYQEENNELDNALLTYEKAKKFMEKNIPEEKWEFEVFEKLVNTKQQIVSMN